MKLVLAGPSESVLTQAAYPVLNWAGFEVLAVVDTPAKLRDVVTATEVDLVVVEANVATDPDEAFGLLSDLGSVPYLAVILPVAWAEQRERLAQLPNLVAGFSAPVAWPNAATQLVARIQERIAADEDGQGEEETGEPASLPSPHPPPSPPAARPKQRHGSGLRVRLGLYGCRGGAGVSSAVLAAARALVEEGWRVALFDSRGRGDLHLMGGLRALRPGPSVALRAGSGQAFDPDNPATHQGITFFPAAPTEETVRGFDAAIVDGGRKRGEFNADWRCLTGPLSEDQVRRMVGLGPREREAEAEESETGTGKTPAEQQAGRTRRKAGIKRGGLAGLISIEVTD